MKYKVTLSIGYPNARHESEIEIDDDEIDDCETESQIEELINNYCMEWAWNYIEIDSAPAKD